MLCNAQNILINSITSRDMYGNSGVQFHGLQAGELGYIILQVSVLCSMNINIKIKFFILSLHLL